MLFPLEVQGVQCKRPRNSSLNTKCRQIPCPTPPLSTAPPLSSLNISTLTPPSYSWLLFISCLIGSISQTTAGFYKWNQLAYLIFASEVFFHGCVMFSSLLYVIMVFQLSWLCGTPPCDYRIGCWSSIPKMNLCAYQPGFVSKHYCVQCLHLLWEYRDVHRCACLGSGRRAPH